jgi:hypothetical protein
MHTHTGLNLGEPTGSSASPRNTAPTNTGASSTRPQTRQPPQGPMTPPATQHQPTIQPPAQQNRPAIQPPAQQNRPNNLPPIGPVAPAGGDHHPANPPQDARPTAGGIVPANPETAPPTVGPNPQSQADEIQALKARLERYERNGAPLANMHQPQVLFSDQETIERIKAATAPSKDGGKKVILPEVVPGFKASSLDVGKSPILPFRTPYCMYSDTLVAHLSSL